MIRVLMTFEDSERLSVRHVSLATWFAQLCNLVNAACGRRVSHHFMLGTAIVRMAGIMMDLN